MKTVYRQQSAFLLTATLLVTLTAVGATSSPAYAQTKPPHRSFIKRHPRIAEAAAGIGAYKVAKHTGRHRHTQGQHRNFAQRHPVITGAAAAGVAHHYAHKK